MNSKFFDVNKDKQDNIINAALKLFATKGYKDASTDVIVKEAGISKGLLFHYFGSKKGLYEFICDYSEKYMTLELTRSVKSAKKDFFTVVSEIELGRCRVARNYPYMHQFLRSLSSEKDPEAVTAMGDSLKEIELTYSNIYSQIDTKMLINPDDSMLLVKLIDWMKDGYTKDELNAGVYDADELFNGFTPLLAMLGRHFCKSDTNAEISVAKEELAERNESVMDDLKMEMTFEERLLAGKRPLVDIPEDELAAQADKEEALEDSDASDSDTEDKSDANENSADETEADDNQAESIDNSDNEAKEDSDASSDSKVDDDIDYFDEEDSEDTPSNGAPAVNTGAIPVVPVFKASESAFSTGDIDKIMEEANENLQNSQDR